MTRHPLVVAATANAGSRARLSCLGSVAIVLLHLAGCGPVQPAEAPPPPTTGAVPPPVATTTATASAAPATPYSGHGAASLTPELLAEFAPKPLPPEVSRRIQTMLDVRAPSSGAVSPDGKALYFSWSVTGVQQLWRLDGPQRFPVQLTGGEDTAGLSDITPDGAELVISRDRNGEENPGIYLQNPGGGPLRAIQHTPGVQTLFEFISDDSRFVYFRANDVKKDSFTLYRYDRTTQKREVVFDQPGIWDIADFRPDGRLLLAKHVGSNMSEYFEWSPATKTLTPLFGQGERETYVAAYGSDPAEILVITPKLGDFRRLYRFKAGKFTPVTPELKFDVSSFSIDAQKQRILYHVNEGGFTRLKGLDAKTFAELKLPPLPEADHHVVGSQSRNGRFTTFVVETGKAPLRSFGYEWKTGKLTEWHVPSAPEVDTSRFAPVKLEHYPARDGVKIPMFVRRPESCAEPCPVIVSFHGGPEVQTKPYFNPNAQLFVDAGFVFVEPNVRGSDGYGKAWLHADDGAKRLAIITDIEDAAKFIRTSWARAGKAPKIGILGGSYGGYSALLGMTMFAGAYDAGASIVGISNLVTFLQNTAPYRRVLRISEYGDPEKDRETLLKLSPITYIDRVTAPMLILQGATDPRVPAGESVQIHRALQAKKLASELMIFPDEGHGSQKRGNKVLQVGHVLRFFEEHLKGKR